MNKAQYLIIGNDSLKASLLWDEETDAWTYTSNSPLNQVGALYRTIPVLYRGVTIISDTVTKVPFTLYRGETEVDTSASWDNIPGYLPNPRMLLKLVSQSLDRHGKAYLLKVRNRGKIVKELKWLEAGSVTPFFDDTTGELLRFERYDDKGRPIVYQPDDIVHFWLEDPDVEVGPPLAWPVKAGMQASGVLHNLDAFISKYFEHGAVRPMMLMTKGFPPPEEKDRIKAWWRGLTGLKNSREIGVFSADSLEPKQIGDGIDQLQNQELTDDQRKDVALALGIPQTILFANSANYATSQSDWLNFHETTIIPRCEMIAETLNDQLFKLEGLELQFTPEGLDIYREDENQRSAALGSLVSAGLPLLMAMDLLGYDLTPEQRAELEALVAQKEERADAMVENMQQKPAEPEQEEPEEGAPMTPEAEAEAKHWRRVCNKALREGKSMPADFVCEHIPAALAAQIAEALKAATDGDGIKRAFEAQEAIPLPADWPVSPDLVLELKRANDILESAKSAPDGHEFYGNQWTGGGGGNGDMGKYNRNLSSAYSAGKEFRAKGYSSVREISERGSPAEFSQIERYDTFELVSLEAALRGKEEPYYAEGWRFGHVPKGGQSYNGRDQRLEVGVSMMELDNGDKTDDLTSALFLSAGRDKYRVGGYVNTVRRGADGEPLLMYARELGKAKE